MASNQNRRGLTRRQFFKRGAMGTAALAGTRLLFLPHRASAADSRARRPNILFIITDDQNFDTLGCWGNKVLTPNLDGLAREGVRFTHGYTASSVCTPSRYSCLTGRYASRCTSPEFMKGNPPGAQSAVGFNTRLEPDGNIGRVLHDAGYVTGVVGKWHTGGWGDFLAYPPEADMRDPAIARILAENQARRIAQIKPCGFDYAASIYWGNLADHKLDMLNVHNMEWVTKGALDFIEQNKDKPFYLMMAPTLHHGPNPLKSIGADERITAAGLLPEPLKVMPPRTGIRERLRKAGYPENTAHATWLDDGVGAVLKRLDDLGLADNTAVFLFSDNATMGGKGTCYDGGARTPWLLRWKGHISPGQVRDELVQNIDFVPTILDICSEKPPAGMRLDGASMLPLLTGKEKKWRDALFFEIGHTRAVATRKWKYIAWRFPKRMQEGIESGRLVAPFYHMDNPVNLQEIASKRHPGYNDPDQLYDLENDPTEQVNLAKDPKYAEVVKEMQGRLREWLKAFDRPFGEFR